MTAASPKPPSSKATRWIGPSGIVAAVIFIAARLALEPIRDLPKFDDKGMDAYAAIEEFRLRKMPEPFEIGVFGSSVAVWGIIPEVLAGSMGEDPARLRLLAVEGGTAFDMWNLVRRNEGSFKAMRLALVEINPRELNQNLEGDPRLTLDLAQHARHSELMMMRHRSDRVRFVAEELLPLFSIRRSLRTLHLNLADPDPGDPLCPEVAGRTVPFDWAVPDPESAVFDLKNRITPDTAARRIAAYWKPSALMTHCLREFIRWMESRGVRVVFFQMPIHPAVAAIVRSDPKCIAGYAFYQQHLEALGIPQAGFLPTFSIEDCGIPEKGLRDHTHLNELGARIYCQHLGGQLKTFLAAGAGH
jgi:hypothetical protein